jgi:hypothetical protein
VVPALPGPVQCLMAVTKNPVDGIASFFGSVICRRGSNG